MLCGTCGAFQEVEALGIDMLVQPSAKGEMYMLSNAMREGELLRSGVMEIGGEGRKSTRGEDVWMEEDHLLQQSSRPCGSHSYNSASSASLLAPLQAAPAAKLARRNVSSTLPPALLSPLSYQASLGAAW